MNLQTRIFLNPAQWEAMKKINNWSDESMRAHFVKTEPVATHDSSNNPSEPGKGE